MAERDEIGILYNELDDGGFQYANAAEVISKLLEELVWNQAWQRLFKQCILVILS